MSSWRQINSFKTNIESKINRLSTTHCDGKNARSPVLKDLLTGRVSKVKILSQVFESKTSEFNPKCNYWLENLEHLEQAASTSQPTLDRLMKISPSHKEGKIHNEKLEKILNELLQNELKYISSLKHGINNYVKTIEATSDEVPGELHGQKFRLFGNIEDIYRLHHEKLYPKILTSNRNIEAIANIFTYFLQNDYFYCYVLYAINQLNADQLCSNHSKFFNELKKKIGDDLGVHSFCILPIQRLPRYQLLLSEIINELQKDMPANKNIIAACCIAEKNIQRLLGTINEAISINDIVECNAYSVSLQCGLITVLQREFGSDLNEPTMFLVPSFSSYHGYRPALNIFKLGKFLKMAELEAHEQFSKRNFKCKLFLFQQGLMYTKIISKRKLGYRDHFKFDNFFDCSVKEIRVGNKLNNHYVTFSSDNVLLMVELKSIIFKLTAQNIHNLSDSKFIANYKNEFNETVEADQSWVRIEWSNFNDKDVDQN